MKIMKIKCSNLVRQNIDKFERLINKAQMSNMKYVVPYNDEDKNIIELFHNELIELHSHSEEVYFLKFVSAYFINDENLIFYIMVDNPQKVINLIKNQFD